MPVETGKDNKGCYAIWGKQGKKYYYECGNSEARKDAKIKAEQQGEAIKANQNQVIKLLRNFVRQIRKG